MAVIDRVGFGCVGLSLAPTPGKAVGLLEAVHDLGIRHFDTAPIYGRGYSERLLGQFLKGRRDKVSIATKFGLSPRSPPRLPIALALGLAALRRRLRTPPPEPRPAAAPSSPPTDVASSRRISRAEVQTSFDGSRRALGTDHIDLYLLHEELPAALEPGAIDFLLDLRSSGKVGKLGVAASGARYRTLTTADLAGWDVLQYEYGAAWPWTADLPGRFPAMEHIFHSSLRGMNHTSPDTPGRAMAACLAAYPSARLLFSSTKLTHIRDNLHGLQG